MTLLILPILHARFSKRTVYIWETVPQNPVQDRKKVIFQLPQRYLGSTKRALFHFAVLDDPR